MSKLTDELEYILRWLEYISDLDFESNWYKPGLTHQEVHLLVKDLPFKLSEEIYELYQWQSRLLNSPPHEFLFPEQIGGSTILLYRLPDSIANYHDLCKLEEEMTIDKPHDNYKVWDRKWFPIASLENKRILYVVGDLDPSPVYLIDLFYCDRPLRIYKSITNMVSVIAECCESDVYHMVADEYDEEYMTIEIDEEKLDLEKTIYLKYNS